MRPQVNVFSVRTNLSVADLGDLLDLPLVATLATYRTSGEVLLSPVWFEWQDGGFNLFVGRKDFKTQHVKRDPRASVAVYENALPLRGLELRGTATLFTDGLLELRKRVWQRYLGIDPPGPAESEIGLRVEGKVRAWDFADDC
jgi:PPOX class probable F420-dependent enzyme